MKQLKMKTRNDFRTQFSRGVFNITHNVKYNRQVGIKSSEPFTLTLN